MTVTEEKARRRLAPFVVEGKIAALQFSGEADALTINVRLKSSPARGDAIEAALHNAVRDLGAGAHLVISHA